jgi:hypothetical protein
MSKLNGTAMAAATAGGILIYSGLSGYSVLRAIQNILHGQPPKAGQTNASFTASLGKDTGGNGPAPKGSYSHAGLMKLWGQAGGSAATARNAACHAMQESSGNPRITSSNPDGGTNVGLWQLDTKGVGAGHSVTELQDPFTNARITVHATKNGLDWSEWATPGC